MHESTKSRLKRLETAQNPLPHAVVTFSDGHKERLDFHQIAVAFFERNRAGIAALEWERPDEATVIFQLLSCPEVWTELRKEDQ